jgi:hypothetical protein
MTYMNERPTVLVLVRDLIFAGRITATARELAVAATLVRDPAKLPTETSTAGLLIVDLNLAGAIDAARQWKRATGGAVTGFVAHTDAETIAAARAAGIDRVLARSRFVEVLPALLGGSGIDGVLPASRDTAADI